MPQPTTPFKASNAVLVLSHEMTADGDPTETSLMRLTRAVEELSRLPDSILFTSGWAYRDDTDKTLADAMADYAINHFGVSADSVLRSPLSRDTVGDAVYFGHRVQADRVAVVTSEFHKARTQQIFRFVMGPKQSVDVVGVGDPATDAQKTSEANSLLAFQKTFKGIDPGDLSAIEARMIADHPLYNGAIDAKALRRHD